MRRAQAVRRYALCATTTVAIALSLGQGCPAPGGGSTGGTDPLPGSSTISAVTTSGAVVGSTGRIRVTLVDPVASETTVTLTALNPSVASVPATLTIVAGSATGEAVYTGVATGSTYLIASLGSSAETSSLTVAPELQLTSVYARDYHQAGASGTLSLSLNIAVASSTPVSLTSSNPAVVSVPATIAFDEFESSEYLPFIAGSPGTTIITATVGSSQASVRVTVTSGVALNYVSIAAKVQPGAVTGLTVSLATSPAATTIVSLVSSDPAVIAVPATMTLPAGTNYMTVPVTAGNIGSAVITASLGGNSASTTLKVIGAVFIDTLGPTVAVEVGAVTSVQLALDTVVATDTSVTITASPPGIISVPTTVVIPAGSSGVSFTEVGLAPGTANITATMTGSSRSTAARVDAQATVTSIAATAPVRVGAAGVVTVFLSGAVAADRTITIANSTPAAFTTPASVVVPSGATNVSFSVIGLANVATTLSATLAPNPPVLSPPITPAP